MGKYLLNGQDWNSNYALNRIMSINPVNFNSVSPDTFSNEDVFHYSIPNVQEYGDGAVEDGSDIASNKLLITEPCVLISKLNPRKSTVCIARPQKLKTLASPEFVPVGAKNESDLRFIYWVLSSPKTTDYLSSIVNSTTNSHQRVQRHDIYRMYLPFPDDSSRKIIADYLHEETAEIDATAAKLDELIEDLGHRRANSIREAIQLAKEKAKTAGIDSLPDLGYKSKMIRRGISPHYTEDGFEDTDNGIRVLNQKCVRENSEIDYSHARRNNIEKKPVSNELLIRPGDILINSTGTGTLGRTALVRDVDEPTTVDSHITIVRHNGTLEDRFLSYFMSFSEDVLVLESRGSTNQIELSQSTVAWLELPLLPLDEQRHIADYLDEETARIDKMKATVTELRDELLARRKAIITEVVTGQKRLVK